MTRLSRAEFIVRMLSKTGFKKWESYAIHRIVNTLDDPEIEFVCQQYVSRQDDGYSLIDLYFPQFNIALEIDEPSHEKKENTAKDNIRSRDIIAVTGCVEKRLKIQKSDGKKLTLEELHNWIENFVDTLRALKKAQGDKFVPWDYETRYKPDTHIERGFIDAEQNVAFANHRDALRCFGYNKGHYQRAVWKIPSRSSWVWFPKFYENEDWDNSISPDGEAITETYKGKSAKHLNRREPVDTRIVFAHDRDALGYTLYRFMGEFKADSEGSDNRTWHYRRVRKRVDLKQFFKGS